MLSRLKPWLFFAFLLYVILGTLYGMMFSSEPRGDAADIDYFYQR